ncbi:MAG TPA: PAS domain S-box protein [Flavisolibacter sp.]|nr:PAS domain S-box protein [Flavisolibacter sp.]
MFSQLLIVETDASLTPLSQSCQSLFASCFETVSTLPLARVKEPGFAASPLLFVHGHLTTTDHLQQYIELQQQFPHSTIVLVADDANEELSLQALEAGAEDVTAKNQLSKTYLRRIIIISRRQQHTASKLLESHSQLMGYVHNTPNVAVQWFNSKAEVLLWNKASERIFGWTAEEAIGKTIGQVIICPEEEEEFIESLRELTQTNMATEPAEYFFRRRDGSEGYCIFTLFRVVSESGEPVFICMDVDVTDRKKAEAALQQSEEKYRLLVEQQADAITIFNEQGQILEVNGSAVQLLQYTRDEFQQMTVKDILLPEEQEQNPVDFASLQQGETTIKQRMMLHKDGSVVETEVHTKSLGNGLYMASVRDLTERLDVQRRLQKEIELSDTIINSLPHLFYVFTKEGKYLRWNQRLQTVTGYSASEIGNITPLHLFDDHEKQLIADAIEKVYEDGQYAVEANLLTKDGKYIPHYFTGLTVNYAGTECLLGVGIDLSAVKTLEKELSQQKIAQQKKIMQAMIRTEEKEKNKLGLELHDNVNQILSVVRMYLSILNSDKPMPEVTLTKTIQLLNTAIEEIRHLSHSLAVSYKFEAGLARVLEEMVEKISVARDFSICLYLPEDLDDCTNNDQKLAIYRIVQEQLNNIMKYAKATEVKVEICTSPNEISMLIEDNGQGFDPAKAGKGLGLSNITTRAESLEGKACVKSAPGKGCRLLVSIPLHVTAETEEN